MFRITEGDLGEALDARTEALSSLRELGPPDLVHLLKQSVRNPSKKVYLSSSPFGVLVKVLTIIRLASTIM